MERQVEEKEQKTSPKDKNRLSFGVELEFLFYYKVNGKGKGKGNGKDKDKDKDEDEEEEYVDPEEVLGHAPAPVYAPKPGEDQNEWGWGISLLQDAILSVPGAQVKVTCFGDVARHPDADSNCQIYLDPDTDGWECKNDASIDVDIDTPPGYDCQAYEITSPALWDCTESYEHVHAVLTELNRRFRLRVNLTTGFHCHVGAGCELKVPGQMNEEQTKPAVDMNGNPFVPINVTPPDTPVLRPRHHSLRVVKRAAALLWAADNFLSYAHPPERAISQYAKPIRAVSRLAYGKECKAIREEEHIIFENRPTLAKPMPSQPDHHHQLPTEDLPSHTVTLSRINDRFLPATRPTQPDDTTLERHKVITSDPVIYMADPLIQFRTVSRGVQTISTVTRRSQIAALLEPSSYHERLNYNFQRYVRDPANEAYGGGPMDRTTGTVEFREAAGSLSPEWVPTWARICTGVFRFARRASEKRYQAVVDRLAQAEAEVMVGGENRYDVISLLLDLGLPVEAFFLARKLGLRGSGDEDETEGDDEEDEAGDPLRFWYPNRIGTNTKDMYTAWTADDYGGGWGREYVLAEEGWGATLDETTSAKSSAFVSTPASEGSPKWYPSQCLSQREADKKWEVFVDTPVMAV